MTNFERRAEMSTPNGAAIAAGRKHPASSFNRTALPLILFCLLGASLVTLALFGNGQGLNVHVFGWRFELECAGLGIILAVLTLRFRIGKGRLDWTEAPVWIGWYVYVQVIVTNWIFARTETPPMPWLNLETDLARAVAIIGCGILSIWLGHEWAIRWKSRPKLRRWQLRIEATAALWLLAVITQAAPLLANSSSVYLGQHDVFSTWSNYLAFVTLVGNMARAILIIHLFRTRSVWAWPFVAAVLGCDVILNVLSGSKGFAVTLLSLAMAAYYGKRRMPVSLLVAGTGLVILFVPVVGMYRTTLHSVSSSAGVADRLSYVNGAVSGAASTSVGELAGNVGGLVLQRQGGLLLTTASVAALHPNVRPYIGRQWAEEFIIGLIPRAIWPSKPETVSDLYHTTMTYWGASREYSFTSIGAFADAYRCGGWAPLVAWGIIWGAIMGRIYVRGPGRGDIFYSGLYVVTMFGVLYYETDLNTALKRLLEFFPLLWFVMRYVIAKPAPSYNAQRSDAGAGKA